MKNVQLHNLRVFCRRNPNATVSDYAKDIRASKRNMKALNNYIASVTGGVK